MKQQIRCIAEERRIAVKNHGNLNGIDYLEVIRRPIINDELLPPLIVVFCFKEIIVDENNGLKKENIVINGGVREKNIQVEQVKRGDSITLTELDKKVISKSIKGQEKNTLVIFPKSEGDFSTYTLHLILSKDQPDLPPTWFDSIFSEINFYFKVECPAEFDCAQKLICPTEITREPNIDYMAKDYASFRQLVLDRLSIIAPDWRERNPADIGIVLVELLAYMGDYLSYYQDAVATEAYLGTARNRISVARHARLLDYAVHNGCNARAWVFFEVNKENDGKLINIGTKLLTGSKDDKTAVEEDEIDKALNRGEKVFETIHKITLYNAHNSIKFYTWGNQECFLPAGSTKATLIDEQRNQNNPLQLKVGDFLLFEELYAPNCRSYVDPAYRHVVRLTKVSEGKIDELDNTPIVEIEWALEDALPFPLCLWEQSEAKSIARGNVVLVGNGYTIKGELLEAEYQGSNLRLKLSRKNLAHQLSLNVNDDTGQIEPEIAAASIFNQNIRDAKPAIFIEDEEKRTWEPQRDLLSSGRFDPVFVVEVENDGSSSIRFGDDINGMNPECDTAENSPALKATYKVGNGAAGNVGAESITRIVKPKIPEDNEFFAEHIIKVSNPLPARGGKDFETSDEVRQYAPQAFRKPERAVIEADYAEIIQREHSGVQRATAIIRWTGSWHTVFVTIDRYGGKEVDEEFKTELINLLNKYRLSGYDVEINGPIYVPVDISLRVCVCPDQPRDEVKKTLSETFSNRDLLDGRRGYFHPDNFTFGQPLYLSHINAEAKKIKGVRFVEFEKFQRLEKAGKEHEEEVIKVGQFEIIQLENDPNFPEKGKIEFIMEGGR